jgi:hypothetical protein
MLRSAGVHVASCAGIVQRRSRGAALQIAQQHRSKEHR